MSGLVNLLKQLATAPLPLIYGGTGATTADQARVNIDTVASASPSASTTLALAITDLDRDQYATGTPTLTMPNGGAGWRSGIVANANTASGLVTLAVPSGATLDGATNGTTTLRPYQRARIRQTGATAYATDWVERTPIVATTTISVGVVSVALLLPVGYSAYEIFVNKLLINTGNVALGLRVSTDGGATFKAGASDYYALGPASTNSSTTVSSAYGGNSYIEFGNTLSPSNGTYGPFGLSAKGVIRPGGAALYPTAQFETEYFTTANTYTHRSSTGVFISSALLANAIQILVTSGLITAGSIVIRGLP